MKKREAKPLVFNYEAISPPRSSSSEAKDLAAVYVRIFREEQAPPLPIAYKISLLPLAIPLFLSYN